MADKHKAYIDDLYSEVPISWLQRKDNKQLCYWPPRTINAKPLITNYTNPNVESWNLYEVDVIKYCTSLESARKSAADSNYETTDEDRLGRGKRQRISYNRFSSEEEENDVPQSCKTYKRKANSMNKISAIPACPDNLRLNNNNENNVNDMNDFPLSQSYEKRKSSCTNPSSNSEPSEKINISQLPIILEDGAPLSAPFEGMRGCLEDSNMKINRNLKEILRSQATSNLILQDIKERMHRIEDVMRNQAPVLTKSSEDSLIAELLPLQTIEAIRNFDLLLHNTNEAVTQFKQFLLRIGGNNPRDIIHRILSKIFSNECAINCSWKGIRNNFKVSNLYFIKIVKREIIFKHLNFTEVEFDNIAAEWLRFAKQRKQRQDKGKDVEREQIDESN
ncbi:uncharacterized protein LOC112638764 [Camponotus floridanus]|uniref:uncharacterized protein LOC112638764 n=1 Tax=Camponotus floridanus TaxID=104421 RepID=UPI000DC6C2DD|nr:uncharacterized protein LOC112638764 [Camponotus floridanus]